MLLASVGVVLVVTCLNVGGLLTARAVARRRETAVRAALGASSWRLLRLSIGEAAVIAVGGGAAGLLLAWAGVAALSAAAPPGIPRLDAMHIDAAALGDHGASRRSSACSSSPQHLPRPPGAT